MSNYRITTDHYDDRYVATAWTRDGYYTATSAEWRDEYQAVADAECQLDAQLRPTPAYESNDTQEADAQPYTGNSTLGFDADDHTPTLILRCQFCPAEIAYYGDAEDTTNTFTFAECEQAVCTCGAIYGEDDTLEVVDEDAQLGTKPPSDVYAEFADLYIPDGPIAIESLIDSRDDALTLLTERDARIAELHEALRAAKALLTAIDEGGQYPHSGFMIGIVLHQITQIVG